jgi:hypothetical protein
MKYFFSNPFVGVKILHDYKLGCDNIVWGHQNLVKICVGLSQTSASLYRVEITQFIFMLDFNPNNIKIYLQWIFGAVSTKYLIISIIIG